MMFSLLNISGTRFMPTGSDPYLYYLELKTWYETEYQHHYNHDV